MSEPSRENPFGSPKPIPSNPPRRIAGGHSIEDEPHLRSQEFPAEDDQPLVHDELARVSQSIHGEAQAHEILEHGVWDEPAARYSASQVEAPGLTYASWLSGKIAATSSIQSWLVCLGATLVAGPLAIVATLFRGNPERAGILMVCLIGPIVEEFLKVALPLGIAERRPYLFKSGRQFILCGLASGLAFAFIENLIYLHVYVPQPSSSLVAWRWTVCVALHGTCSGIAALGPRRIWGRTMVSMSRPEFSLAIPWLVAAVCCHAAYNSLVTFLELSGHLKLLD